jgi:hypothetical protein
MGLPFIRMYGSTQPSSIRGNALNTSFSGIGMYGYTSPQANWSSMERDSGLGMLLQRADARRCKLKELIRLKHCCSTSASPYP